MVGGYGARPRSPGFALFVGDTGRGVWRRAIRSCRERRSGAAGSRLAIEERVGAIDPPQGRDGWRCCS